MAAQFRSPAQPKSNQKKPYRPPSPPSPRIFRDFSILRPTFRSTLSLSLSPFDSPIDSKARIELENLNFLFSLNLKFRNRIRAVRRTAGRRPPIRSFIIFRSEDRGLHPPFHTFSLPFSLPSISLPTLSPALLDASLFFARRFFSANFPPRSFNPFQSATWIDLSLSVEFHSIRYFSFFVLSQCFLFFHLEFHPLFHPSEFFFPTLDPCCVRVIVKRFINPLRPFRLRHPRSKLL